MRLSSGILFLVAGVCALHADDLNTSQKRMVTVNLARSLLTPVPTDPATETEGIKNPFNPLPPAPAVAEAGTPAAAVVVMGDHERLEMIARQINPSGMVQLGSQPILLFSQKKLKVGEHLSIVFEGATYEVQLVAIERTQFTLRLNNEEVTRPIKSAPAVAPKP